ncbi:hypothetical protein BJI48_02870 [Helicobacter sp. 11S02596-1]|nr:hypothetical protein BJI48_02870 [Helicobacter sp. 11S02596-1]
MGIGFGYSFDKYDIEFLKYTDKGKENVPALEFFAGGEYIFDDFNGIQINLNGSVLLSHDDPNKGTLTAGINYVFEPQDYMPNFAIITGFDLGLKYSLYAKEFTSGCYSPDCLYFYMIYIESEELKPAFHDFSRNHESSDNGINTSFIMDYNLGFRIRLQRFALLFNVKIPLFRSSIPLEARYYVYETLRTNKPPIDWAVLESGGKLMSYPITTTASLIFFF